ncbi:MAG: ABC transporter ATP-binding protein [Lachnospiraceae bacterium]|nr:ABC transporter ATP-binding protein [Lachnospiraceae bacterium]
MIQVENLVKKYGDHMAVDHLTFTIEKGKVYGFLGPNGAGKSTTMNMITGYLGATGGTIKINGMDMVKNPEKAKRCIGYLPEIPPVYPDMTVKEYLQFAAELKGLRKEDKKENMEKVMNMVQLMDVKDRLIRNLSKGYRQRVGLAQAILGFPDVIILDEPTVGLDPKQIMEIRDLIRSLGKDHTVILSSHILSEVSAVCDQILIISRGKLMAQDTPENLEHLMEKEQRVHMSIHGDPDKIRSVLDKAEFIRSYTGTEENTYDIIAEKQKDIREKLFYLCASHQLPIVEMTSSMVSLEDVFLELTSEHYMDEIEMKKIEEQQVVEQEIEEQIEEQDKKKNKIKDVRFRKREENKRIIEDKKTDHKENEKVEEKQESQKEEAEQHDSSI